MSQTMVSPQGVPVTKIFSGPSVSDVQQQMDISRQYYERLGYTFESRRSIGRNTPCPCGSGRKFKKCCIDSVQQAERRVA